MLRISTKSYVLPIQLGERTDASIEGRTLITDGYKVNETFI